MFVQRWAAGWILVQTRAAAVAAAAAAAALPLFRTDGAVTSAILLLSLQLLQIFVMKEMTGFFHINQ